MQEAKDVIEKYKVDVFCFDYSEIYGDKEVQRHTFLEEGFYDKNKLKKLAYPNLICNSLGQRFFPNLCTKIIKKELYEQFQNYSKEAIKIGGDESVALPCVFFAESIYISRKIFLEV